MYIVVIKKMKDLDDSLIKGVLPEEQPMIWHEIPGSRGVEKQLIDHPQAEVFTKEQWQVKQVEMKEAEPPKSFWESFIAIFGF